MSWRCAANKVMRAAGRTRLHKGGALQVEDHQVEGPTGLRAALALLVTVHLAGHRATLVLGATHRRDRLQQINRWRTLKLTTESSTAPKDGISAKIRVLSN